MLTPTVTALTDLPSAHPAVAGAHAGAPVAVIAMERVVRPRLDRKAPA